MDNIDNMFVRIKQNQWLENLTDDHDDDQDDGDEKKCRKC